MVQVYPYGAVELRHEDKATFKANGQRVKLYVNGDFRGVNSITYLDDI